MWSLPVGGNQVLHCVSSIMHPDGIHYNWRQTHTCAHGGGCVRRMSERGGRRQRMFSHFGTMISPQQLFIHKVCSLITQDAHTHTHTPFTTPRGTPSSRWGNVQVRSPPDAKVPLSCDKCKVSVLDVSLHSTCAALQHRSQSIKRKSSLDKIQFR